MWWMLACQDPKPVETYRFGMTLAEIEGHGPTSCAPGTRTGPTHGGPVPLVACTAVVDLPEATAAVRIWELTYPSTSAATEAAAAWRDRLDGADPGDVVGKGLVTAWSEEDHVYVVSARSQRFEPGACAVLATFRATEAGMFRCPGG
jgi:hypothetical protein